MVMVCGAVRCCAVLRLGSEAIGSDGKRGKRSGDGYEAWGACFCACVRMGAYGSVCVCMCGKEG